MGSDKGGGKERHEFAAFSHNMPTCEVVTLNAVSQIGNLSSWFLSDVKSPLLTSVSHKLGQF